MTIALAHKTLSKSVRDTIDRTIFPILDDRASGKGPCSSKTREERRQFYHLMVAQLWEQGFKIRKLENLAGKHVTLLMNLWHEQGICAGTLHTRRSMMGYLCNRLGKYNVVKDLADYLPPEVTRRCSVVTESKTWEDNGVKPLEVIDLARRIDERLAVILAMQHFFGLRVKESIEIRPLNAVIEGGEWLEVYEGTKGGRPRHVRIQTDDQRDVIAWARRIAASGNTKRLRWTDCTWKQAQNRFYHLMRYRLGITKALKGVSAHGLRHGYANRRYKQESGYPSPVQGGALGRIDRETHRNACITVSRSLGHGRIDVTPSYYGSYGHALRVPPVTSMAVTFRLDQTNKFPA